MLHLYIDECDVPSGVIYVKDNEMFFDTYTIQKLDKDVNMLLSNTDKAVYNDSDSFLDRFGYKFPWSYLSTGGKTVLNVYYNPDVCFDTFECGENALTDIKNLKRGMVVPNYILNLDCKDEIEVIVDDNDDRRYMSYAHYVEEE